MPLGTASTQLVTAGSVPFTLRVTVSRSGMYAEDTQYVWITGYGGLLKVTNTNIPRAYMLHANHPNPFNPATIIPYDLPEASIVTLVIYDLTGREVRSWTLNESAGYRQVVWDGRNKNGYLVPSGIYIYRLVATSINSNERFMNSRKMLLLK